MALFLARTWFLWWTVVAVMIVRWFYVASARRASEFPGSSNDAGQCISRPLSAYAS
jgi:hypothetical protein